jgi:hypothetical protein
MILTVRPARRSEAVWLGERLREEDAREVQASTGRLPSEVLPVSLALSPDCYTVRLDVKGRPAFDPCAIFGCAPSRDVLGAGVIWLLCSDEIRHAPLSLLREARSWVDHFAMMYPAGLYNYVDTRNHQHVRWLKLLGFTFYERVMRNGVEFVLAYRKGENDV